MYIIIGGGGLMGLTLAEKLVERKHDVLVIDADPKVCDYAQSEIGVMVHCGAATSTRVLETVGMRRADIAVAMMRDDACNLAFLLLAKNLGVPRRLVRMREHEFEQPYILAGATAIASSVAPLIDQLLVNIEFPEIKSLMRIGKGNIDVFEVSVPQGARVAGMTVEAVAQIPGFPATCNFVAVEPSVGVIEIARGTTVLPGGANAILLGMEADLRGVIELLTAIERPSASSVVSGGLQAPRLNVERERGVP